MDDTPAFPTRRSDFSATQTEGMSLRDWFAGMALNGMLSIPTAIGSQVGDEVHQSPEKAAAWAYQHADAMLTARARKT